MRRPCHVPPRDASVPRRDGRDGAVAGRRGAFTLVARTDPRLAAGRHGACIVAAMHIHLADPADVADAATLIAAFGEAAAGEAAIRAGRSRELGNHIHFCRWRQVERLVVLLRSREVAGTVH